MRRYRVASWLLLIHSIINFTLAAPIAIGDIHEVHVNVVDITKDRVAVLKKRMDPDEGQSSDLTSEHGPQPQGPEPEPDSDSDPEIGSELSEWDSGDSDGGEAAQQWEDEFQNYEPSDIEEEDHEEGDSEEDNHEEDDHERSPHTGGVESQYSAASTYEDLWDKLLKGSLRPRTSTSGAVDAPKELQKTDDTRTSTVRDVNEFLNAPAISASSVIGRDGATSPYSPPCHRQNRKKWMLDRLV